MKKFLNLIITAFLILPTTINFNNNQNELVATNDDALAFNIEKFHTYQDLWSMDKPYMGTSAVVDLTALTGISSMEVFKKFYWRVELPDFYAGIELFTRTPQIHTLSIATTEWEENWSSDFITLVEDEEIIGSAIIHGRLQVSVYIIKDVSLNHLCLTLNFYGGGYFGSTSSRPMGEIDSGWVMKLVIR